MLKSRVFLFLSLVIALQLATSCTVLFAGSKATSDGSVFVTHSSDGDGETDPRLVRIPARTYPKGSKRPIYASPESYPRYVGYDKEAAPYHPTAGQKEFIPIGYIDQVESTYAYFEETYAAVNEHQLAVGEATCSARFSAWSVDEGGKALLSIDELTRIALERTTNATAAIKLMGSLAEKYGFYGPGFEGTGESLIVADTVEGWVFHILPDDTGSSAIWAAQRIPDTHVSVIANMFIIREIDENDTDNFMVSSNAKQIALKHGFIKQGEKLDFTKAFSTGEYSHLFYSGRRVWRAMTLLAPKGAANLPANYTNLRLQRPYPFSIKPDNKVTLKDLFTVHRDYLEGTKMDLTQGLPAGAFGNPDRYTSGKGEREVKGSWERPIGMFRTSDTYVVQLRDWLSCKNGAVIWYGPHAAQSTVFVPFAVGMNALPSSYEYGVQAVFNRSTAFWAHRYAYHIVGTKYSYAIKDLKAHQTKWEIEGEKVRDTVDALWKEGKLDIAGLTKAYTDHAARVVADTWDLADRLVFKYADGFINEPGKIGQSPGYPAWWLKAVGYENGPPPPTASASCVQEGAVTPIPAGLRMI